MNLKLTPYVKTAKNVITANSPALLVGTAIAGVISTAVLAARGGYKARGILDEAAKERAATVPPQPPLDTMEKVKLTWLCYATPGVTAASSILSIVGLHTIHTKRHATMAAMYTVASGKLDTMTEEAEKLLGPKKAQDLTNAMAQKSADENPIDDNEVIITGEGKDLWYDEWSGRWFTSTLSKVQQAINEVNRAIIDDGEACLNDFYEFLGLRSIPMGSTHGWSKGEGATPKVNGRYGAIRTTDGRAANSIYFHEIPLPNLGRPSGQK